MMLNWLVSTASKRAVFPLSSRLTKALKSTGFTVLHTFENIVNASTILPAPLAVCRAVVSSLFATYNLCLRLEAI